MTEQLTSTLDQEHEPKYDKVVRVMDRLHAEEVFATPEMSKEFLDSLSFEEFTKWTDMLNGMVREIPVPERGMKGDGSIQEGLVGNDFSISYQPPVPEERVALMKEAFERSKQFEDPQLAGLCLAFSVNVIHPYSDGNGRTSRMLYSLLSHGYDGSDEDKNHFTELLKNGAGRRVVKTDPSAKHIDSVMAGRISKSVAKEKGFKGVVPSHIYDGYDGVAIDIQQPSMLTVGESINDESREKLHYVMKDEPFNMAAFMSVLPLDQFESSIRVYDGGKRVQLDGESLVAGLSKEQIDELSILSKSNKINYVRDLINLSDSDYREIADIYDPQSHATKRPN
jgi:hypothetical protein